MSGLDGFKIKPELKDEWTKCAGENCHDGYSFGVVIATIAAFGALDQGQTCAEAERAATSIEGEGITGFMAGCMAQWVSKFHERGDEFRKYWNDKFGVSEEESNGGVVNPALLEIKTD